MGDRLPGHAAGKERGEGYGNIGEHEDGEGEGVHDLLPRRRVDTLPLTYGGGTAYHEQSKVGIHQHGEQGLSHYADILSGDKAIHRCYAVCKHADKGEYGRGHNVHGHVKAGEAAVRYAAQEVLAVLAKHL